MAFRIAVPAAIIAAGAGEAVIIIIPTTARSAPHSDRHLHKHGHDMRSDRHSSRRAAPSAGRRPHRSVRRGFIGLDDPETIRGYFAAGATEAMLWQRLLRSELIRLSPRTMAASIAAWQISSLVPDSISFLSP